MMFVLIQINPDVWIIHLHKKPVKIRQSQLFQNASHVFVRNKNDISYILTAGSFFIYNLINFCPFLSTITAVKNSYFMTNIRQHRAGSN